MEENLEPDMSILSYSLVKQEAALFPMFLSSFLSLLHASGFEFDKQVKDNIFKSLKIFLKGFFSDMEAKSDEAQLRTFLKVISSVFSIVGPSSDVLDLLGKSDSPP